MNAEDEKLIHELIARLTDVLRSLDEIQETLKNRETKAEQIMSAIRRAINQFLSQI